MSTLFTLNRRNLLKLAGINLLLTGCGSGTIQSQIEGALYKASDPLNRSFEQLLFSPTRLAQEFGADRIEPQALLINTAEDVMPMIDPATYQLTVGGLVKKPLKFSLAELKALSYRSVTANHICVEGWSAIVQWGGVPLVEILKLVQPNPAARYVKFRSAPGMTDPVSSQLTSYLETWDLASCIHPQTLLAYEKNSQPLPIENGAPIRLSSPVKLGYKQIKWVTDIALVSEIPAQAGYWIDQGYEWYGGV